MAVLAKCSYFEAKEFKGKSLSTKIGNHKHSVHLMVSCDDFNILETVELAKICSCILVVEYVGSIDNPVYQQLNQDKLSGCALIRVMEVGNNICSFELETALDDLPEGVELILKLPHDFNDVEKIWRFCQEYGGIRFVGSDMLAIEGAKFGYFDQELLDSKKIKSVEDLGISYDRQFGVDIVALEDLEVNAVSGIRNINSSNRVAKSKKPQFSNLLYGSGKVDL